MLGVFGPIMPKYVKCHCFPDTAGHNYIGSEHLLLGLLREGEGVAARVLEKLGADPSNIRTQVCSSCLIDLWGAFGHWLEF